MWSVPWGCEWLKVWILHVELLYSRKWCVFCEVCVQHFAVQAPHCLKFLARNYISFTSRLDLELNIITKLFKEWKDNSKTSRLPGSNYTKQQRVKNRQNAPNESENNSFIYCHLVINDVYKSDKFVLKHKINVTVTSWLSKL